MNPRALTLQELIHDLSELLRLRPELLDTPIAYQGHNPTTGTPSIQPISRFRLIKEVPPGHSRIGHSGSLLLTS